MTGPTKGLGAGVGLEVGGMDMEEIKEAYEVVKRIDISTFLLVRAGSLLIFRLFCLL
jgi:hypothetical protein